MPKTCNQTTLVAWGIMLFASLLPNIEMRRRAYYPLGQVHTHRLADARPPHLIYTGRNAERTRSSYRGPTPMYSTALSNDTESLAVARARAGDGQAFSRLVAAYQTPIYNLCYRLLGNPHDAEEAAQEAFLRAYTRLDSYDPARPFKTWLFSIAHHYCIDRLRRRRLIWLSLDDEPELQPANWRAATPTPEEQAMRREREADVQAALDSLPPKDRSALIMRYWYDLSYEEIAQATASTVSAVKSRLHRARCSLAPMVKPAGNAQPDTSPRPRRAEMAFSCPTI